MAIKVARSNIANNIPIGMVAQSMLTESQFQEINGVNWVLADGRSVAGSVYEAVTGNSNLPDLRGMVLRGKNNARVDGFQNPDGELALGTFQEYEIPAHTHPPGSLTTNTTGSHSHSIPGNVNSGPTGPYSDQTNLTGVNSNTNPAGNHSHSITGGVTGPQGGNENRMRNVTVNNFIKINP
jgi:hypothetical protein